jgi:hypothetical protein
MVWVDPSQSIHTGDLSQKKVLQKNRKKHFFFFLIFHNKNKNTYKLIFQNKNGQVEVFVLEITFFLYRVSGSDGYGS